MRHYAVCPACDNPVQIVGLIETKASSPRPYAKHYHEPIISQGKELGRFSKGQYQWCPYSRKSKKQLTKADKVPMSELALEIIDHIRTHYDRIIYFIESMLGIGISKDQAERILQDYIAEEGYLYAGSTLINIPWMIAYMARAQSLLDTRLREPDGELGSALSAKVTEAHLNQNRFLKRKPGQPYIILTHCLLEHRRSCPEHTLKESLTWIVTLEKHFIDTVVFEKCFDFDYAGYQRLLNYKGWHKNDHLLEIARKLLFRFPSPTQ